MKEEAVFLSLVNNIMKNKASKSLSYCWGPGSLPASLVSIYILIGP